MKKKTARQGTSCFRRWSRKAYGIFASLGRCVNIGVLSVGMSIISSATAGAQDRGADTTTVYRSVEMERVSVAGRQTTSSRSITSQTPVFKRSTESVAPLQTIESALRLSPAVDVRERGGKGIQTDISIRGGSFDQTMVSLNGINFTDARTGHQSHSLPIDINAVSSINVIDGVSGVGAYAGAVDIRTAPLYPRYVSVEATGGAYDYYYGSLAGGYTTDRLSLLVTGSARHSGGYTHNTDFMNYNGYARLSYSSPRAGLFDMQVGYQNRAFGANGFYSLSYPDQFEQTSTALASLRWLRQGERLRLTANVSYRMNTDRFELIRGDASKVPFNYHITDNIGAEAAAAYSWIAGETSVGIDMAYNHILSTVLGEECAPKRIRGIEYNHSKGRTTVNATLRHEKRWQRLSLTGAAGVSRYDYGTDALWNIGADYTAGRYWSFDAGVVESMRLPTYTDLYYTAAGYRSDRNLKPEYTTQYNLGAAYKKTWRHDWFTGLQASVDVYYNTVKDKIIATPTSNQLVWTMVNLGYVEIRGVDVSVTPSLRFGPVNVSARLNYTCQKAQDFTDSRKEEGYEGVISTYGDQIPYVPLHSGSAVVSVSYRTWDFHYSFVYTGERYMLGGNVPVNYIQPWYTSDLSVSKIFHIKKMDIGVTAEVNNIFNQQYEVVKWYPMPGTNFRITLSLAI